MKIITSVVPVEPPKEYTLILNQEELDLITAVLDAQKSLPQQAQITSSKMAAQLKPLRLSREELTVDLVVPEVIEAPVENSGEVL